MEKSITSRGLQSNKYGLDFLNIVICHNRTCSKRHHWH